MKKKQYQSELLMVIHQFNEVGYKLGLVTDKEMRELDEDCLAAEAIPVRGDAAVLPSPPGSANGRENAAAKTAGRARKTAAYARPKA